MTTKTKKLPMTAEKRQALTYCRNFMRNVDMTIAVFVQARNLSNVRKFNRFYNRAERLFRGLLSEKLDIQSAICRLNNLISRYNLELYRY